MSHYISLCSVFVFLNFYLKRFIAFIGSLKYFIPSPRTLMMIYFMKMISGLNSTKMGKIYTHINVHFTEPHLSVDIFLMLNI